MRDNEWQRMTTNDNERQQKQQAVKQMKTTQYTSKNR